MYPYREVQAILRLYLARCIMYGRGGCATCGHVDRLLCASASMHQQHPGLFN